ncbi:15395_t:CDS:1, partial [Racocetra persica]
QKKQSRLSKNSKSKSIDDKNTSSLLINKYESIYINIDSSENDNDEILYNFCNFEELILAKFRDSKEKEKDVKFSVIVKIEELINKETSNNT